MKQCKFDSVQQNIQANRTVPRKAIRDMAPIIDPEEDYLTIVAAEERIAFAEAKRKKELEEAHTAMKGLYETIMILYSFMIFECSARAGPGGCPNILNATGLCAISAGSCYGS